ncbi:receptor-like protein kinase HSL1 isoform X1 [Nicotiana tomentosiformis]|uniref:receptor-like protein kinase HSL1 isoform X1 n=2 Tax=Nicotiana tomentosiformis TaxID=4098 RepID=UPI00051C328D|nr:receptor-like protein kinase HSL1 isoform X1 [Nicotiana tomentosiformis]
MQLFIFFLSTLPLIFALNQDGLYLQRLKLSLSDTEGAFSSWSEQDPTPCNWTGITCNDAPSPSVIAVNLSGASLAGPFPIFLCHLTSLSSLSLSNNLINSTLPLSISECRSLTYLDLSQNLVGGPIPETIADLPYLRYLDLSGCYFTGDIPASFGKFQQLETLILTENVLTGKVPAMLGNVTSLRTIELAYNPFAPSQFPPELGNLTNLETLWLSMCNLVGSLPLNIEKLSRLTNFDVSNNRLVGSIPSTIFQLNSIVQIELYNNSLTGFLPSGWSNLTRLRRFDVSTNKLNGTIPDELCELSLESLNLFENQFEGLFPESIAKSANLYELKLFSNRFSGSLPSELGKNSALQYLDVSYNKFSGKIPESLCEMGALEDLIMIYNSFSGSIPASLGNCRSLRRVRFRGNQLYGEVPTEFWSLPQVYLLDLFGNAFSGNISHMISGAKNMSNLQISRNKLSGVIPSEVGKLKNLVEFSASHNELTGEIPGTLVHLGQLGTLDLSFNELSGEIPLGIHTMKQLSELNLANNGFSGKIPEEIGTLPVLNYLDLSGNYFSGEIPLSLQSLKLNKLNLSNNRLSGTVPAFFDKGVYSNSFLGNPSLCQGVAGLCTAKSGGNRERYLWVLRAIYTIAGFVFLVGIAMFIWRYQKFKKIKKGITISKWTSFHKLGFSELEIPDGLDEANVIGNGASGRVYKAVLSNGEAVAVKKLWERSVKDETGFGALESDKDEFEMEVETLGKIRHKNIVRLWCCCDTGDSKLLVYEYMPNGSLGDLLHSCKAKLLDWPLRFKIALDAAEGLSYLHHDCVPPIVHRDVKSNNILLDGEFGAKISDFGVAKIVKAASKGGAESMSVIAGSCGYIAPEYAYTLHVNEKSDIYSFGVVILELVTGRRPVGPEFGEKDLATWVRTTLNEKGVDQLLDPNLNSTFKEHICKVLDIGLCCLNHIPANRPSMRRVVKMLQESVPYNVPGMVNKNGKLLPYFFPKSV